MPVRNWFALVCLSLNTTLSLPLLAQDPPAVPVTPDAADTTTLDTITVTASKAERKLSEVPATQSVIEAEQLERELVEDLRDLVRYEPGVTVPYQGSRFGNAGLSIRGLGGNRVQTKIDGVPIADSFSIGSFSNAGRDFIDFDLLKRVEIVRGPASSLYGSDALGGVASFTTHDPADLRSGNSVRMRAGYSGADESTAFSGTGAAAIGEWSGLLNLVRREGHELDNAGTVGGTGSARTRPDPHDFTGEQLLAKLLWNEASGAPLRLTLEHFQNESKTESLSGVRSVPSGPPGASPTTITDTTRLAADDQARRQRLSLDQRLTGVLGLDTLIWRLYQQDSRTRQDTFEARTVTSVMSGTRSERERERRALFNQRVLGAETTLTQDFAFGSTAHRLVTGIEVEGTETDQSRDGRERNLSAGTETKTVGPDTFPVRDFPETDTLKAGAYAQDDIHFGRLTLVPGVRLDYYDLKPQTDDIFREDNPGIAPKGLTETQLSPKLGAIYAFTENTSAWASYALGFRAPPYNDVNVGFTNLQFGYTAIPNPDLKPETSRGLELGLRSGGTDFSWQLAAFHNRYDDFIESLVDLGPNANGLLVFQSQNLSEVTIKGLEARGDLALRRLAPALADLHLRSALAYARGDDDTAHEPLNSIEPLTGVLGLAWAPSVAPLELELVATATDGKSRVNESAGALFKSPGGVRLDLLAAWQPRPRVEVNAGLFNLADRKLFAWSDAQGRTATDPAIDRYTQPGFNASVNLRVQF